MSSNGVHRVVRSFASTVARNPPYEWCVVGAGPAGIAVVGQLLAQNISPSAIAWIDPAFQVGDFGTKWRDVSSNTTVRLFKKFCRACPAFKYDTNTNFMLETLNDSATCQLDVAAEPLRAITTTLREAVDSIQTSVVRLSESHQSWKLETSDEQTVMADNVVLTIGAVQSPATDLSKTYPHLTEIPMTTALKPSALASAVTDGDRVALFGSSHSAVIVMRDLLQRGIPVVNIFRSPLRYALYLPDMILFDDTGLKGGTAQWARDNLHTDRDGPVGLTRLLSNDPRTPAAVNSCNKVVYATGFARRQIAVDGLENPIEYNPHCGMIAPGLFGCGIGFPQLSIDRYGNKEMRVGLWKFMSYIEGVMPLWMQYSVKKGIGQSKGSAPADVQLNKP